MEPHRHPKWRDVNLAATVPGWTRWSVAEEMLNRTQTYPRVAEFQQKDPRAGEFRSSLKYQDRSVMDLTQEQRDALFRDFLRWRDKRGQPQERGETSVWRQ